MFQSLKFIFILSTILILSWCGLEKKEITITQPETSEPSWISASPRHQEWVEIDNNWKTIYAWVVYPEVANPAPVVLLIHENKWLNDWARQMADDLAAQWYIVIAPDLLSSISADKKMTSDFATEDEATKALYTLTPEGVMSDLKAVESYADTIQGANGKIASVWFCWGGSQSFRYATASSGIDHTFVFYGSAPEDSDIFANISAPVTAYYGWDDERINSTINNTETNMNEYNKTYTYDIYPGAWHAFMRNALAPDASQANKDAREKAFWDMLLKLQDLRK